MNTNNLSRRSFLEKLSIGAGSSSGCCRGLPHRSLVFPAVNIPSVIGPKTQCGALWFGQLC